MISWSSSKGRLGHLKDTGRSAQAVAGEALHFLPSMAAALQEFLCSASSPALSGVLREAQLTVVLTCD